MIAQKTAGLIWECYREIATSKKLLADIAAARQEEDRDDRREFKPSLRDVFGRRQDLQLSVPSGHDSHRLFNVDPDLAEAVIRAHMAKKGAELEQLNERARLELDISAPNHDADAVPVT